MIFSVPAILQFFLSQWIWSVTFALSMIPLALTFMILLFFFVERYSFFKSCWISILAQACALAVFSGIVVLVIIKILHIPSPDNEAVLNPLYACLCLGGIYTVLEGIFFAIAQRYTKLFFRRALVILFLSNLLASLITYVRI